MLSWILVAGDQFPEAVRLVCASPTAPIASYLFFRRLAEHPALSQHPLPASKVLAFVLEYAETPTRAQDSIAAVIAKLISHQAEGSKPLLIKACHRAGELGCADAGQWLTQVHAMPQAEAGSGNFSLPPPTDLE